MAVMVGAAAPLLCLYDCAVATARPAAAPSQQGAVRGAIDVHPAAGRANTSPAALKRHCQQTLPWGAALECGADQSGVPTASVQGRRC